MKQYQGEFFRAIEEDSFGTRVLSTADVYAVCYAVFGAVKKNKMPFYTEVFCSVIWTRTVSVIVLKVVSELHLSFISCFYEKWNFI